MRKGNLLFHSFLVQVATYLRFNFHLHTSVKWQRYKVDKTLRAKFKPPQSWTEKLAHLHSLAWFHGTTKVPENFTSDKQLGSFKTLSLIQELRMQTFGDSYVG